ncbi:MAG: hypothetical protein ACM3Q4_05440 [Acidobacteriota bacterium]
MTGCTDNTNSVGNSLIGNNEKFTIADTTIGAVSDTVFNVSAPNGSGAVNVVGRTSDVESKMWLRMSTGAVSDTLGLWAIDTVELRLVVAYTWNPPSAPAEFEVREALSGWTQAGATRDSLSQMQIGSQVLGRITRQLNLHDTITVQLDTAAIRRMLTFSSASGAAPFYGFVIVPKPGTTTGMVGFASAVNSLGGPAMTIRLSKNGTYVTMPVLTYGEDTFIATANRTTGPELEVRGGVSTWSKLKFDVSGLSPSLIINDATLELTQKSELLGAGTPDSLYAYLSRKGNAPSAIDSAYRIPGKRKSGTGTTDPVYEFRITPYVQFMIAQGSVYDGIVLHAPDNLQSVNHMVFYSSKDADVTKRPRVLITTSKK